jgi:hypothetical protein
MAQGPSPLLGYNTNVRHKGKLYHIQTEDSGLQHPHIITHLFADGGRIVSSKKTGYAQHIGVEDIKTFVKKMMQDQHKGMLISLRDGVFDESEGLLDTSVGGTASAESAGLDSLAAMPNIPALGALPSAKLNPGAAKLPGKVDFGALDRAAAKLTGDKSGTGRYQAMQAPRGLTPQPRSKPPESIFGGDVLSEKSLDEVILSYLASDLDEGES